MRVAIDLTSLADNFSGIERYAACMTQALLKIDDSNEYVLYFKDEVHPEFSAYKTRDNVTTEVLSSHGLGKLIFSQLILPRALYCSRTDCSLFFAFPAPLLYRGPSISTIHDLSCYDCPETMTAKSLLLWRALDRHAVSKNKRVITISQFSKDRIVSHYKINPRRVVVAYCGVNQEQFNTEAGRGREEEIRERYSLPSRYFLSLATIEPRKNLKFLIKSWAEAFSQGRIDADLVLAGRRGWKTEGLLKEIPEKVMQHIHFTGFIADSDLPVLYRESLAFVFPSRYEGFGLPPVEAMASGARVICSDIPALREICEGGAEYFSISESEDLIRCLCTITVKTNAFDPRNYTWNTEAEKIRLLLDRADSCNENSFRK